jgi:hypothetical protein
MKKYLFILAAFAISTAAFAKAEIYVDYNYFEKTGTKTYEHSSCKLLNKDNFFEKRSLKALKKKGYVIIDKAPVMPEGGILNADIDAMGYLIPGGMVLSSSSRSINGKSSIATKGVYGLQEVMVGGLVVTIPGTPDFLEMFQISGSDKKSDKLRKAIKKKVAELLPPCVVKKI